MLRLDDPPYPNWDQDATAVEDDYNGQDPAIVAAELQNAALRLAEAFERVDDGAMAAKGPAQRRRPVHASTRSAATWCTTPSTISTT